MTGELIGLLEGETQEASISEEGAVNIPVLQKMIADYKIVRVNTRTNKSDIIYHGMPEKQSVSRIKLVWLNIICKIYVGLVCGLNHGISARLVLKHF